MSIHLNHKLLDAARVASLKQAGLHILVYTVNKPQRAAELLRWGVDSSAPMPLMSSGRISSLKTDLRRTIFTD